MDRSDALQEHLRDRGIFAGILYPSPIHQQRAYAGTAALWPLPRSVSEYVCKHVLCLPMHPSLSAVDVDRVANAVNEFLVTVAPSIRAAA